MPARELNALELIRENYGEVAKPVVAEEPWGVNQVQFDKLRLSAKRWIKRSINDYILRLDGKILTSKGERLDAKGASASLMRDITTNLGVPSVKNSKGQLVDEKVWAKLVTQPIRAKIVESIKVTSDKHEVKIAVKSAVEHYMLNVPGSHRFY